MHTSWSSVFGVVSLRWMYSPDIGHSIVQCSSRVWIVAFTFLRIWVGCMLVAEYVQLSKLCTLPRLALERVSTALCRFVWNLVLYVSKNLKVYFKNLFFWSPHWSIVFLFEGMGVAFWCSYRLSCLVLCMIYYFERKISGGWIVEIQLECHYFIT